MKISLQQLTDEDLNRIIDSLEQEENSKENYGFEEIDLETLDELIVAHCN